VRKKWLKPLIAVAIIVALTAASAAYWVTRDKGTPRLIQYDSQQIVVGKRVYEEQCARCHGMYLEGQLNWQTPLPNGRLPAPPHNDNGHTWHHPDSYLFSITKYGMVPPYAPEGYQSDMPAFQDVLSDEEIVDVLLYIKGRWTEGPLEHQRRVTKEVDGPFGGS
jgi:mono/diheme cytochrome c family protein